VWVDVDLDGLRKLLERRGNVTGYFTSQGKTQTAHSNGGELNNG